MEAALVRRLSDAATRLKATTVTIRRGDGIAALRSLPRGSVDLVFLDPPFGSPLAAAGLAAAREALAPDGRIHLESGAPLDDAELSRAGLKCVRYRAAGAVHAQLLARDDPAPSVGPAPYTAGPEPSPGETR